MKALTLWQPWASLIALGVKTIETRGWSTNYRGPLAIHAAKRPPKAADVGPHGWIGEFQLGRWTADVHHAEPCDCDEDENVGPSCAALSDMEPALLRDEGAHGYSLGTYLPLGAVVATCRLVDCVPMVDVMTGKGPVDHDASQWAVYLVPNRLTLVDRFVSHWAPGAERDITDQRPYGDFAHGRYAWLLDDIERVEPPAPATGRQALWEWTP